MRKNLLLVAAFLAVTFCVKAQYPTVPINTWDHLWAQMLNVSNTYYNTITWSQGVATNLGSQIDTVSNGSTKSFGTCRVWQYIAGNKFPYPQLATNLDTFTYWPVLGQGVVTLEYSILKCTGTDTVLVTPYGSSDGIHWVAASTTATVTPTSLTVPVVGAFNYTNKYWAYYKIEVQNATTGSTSVSVQTWIDFWLNVVNSRVGGG